MSEHHPLLSESIVFVRFGKAGLDHLPVQEQTACGLKIPASAVRTNVGRHVCPACEARDSGRIELIERVLDWLYQAPEFSIASRNVLHSGKRITAWDFDGAEPFVDAALHGGVVGWEGDEMPEPWQVEWPLDVRIITQFTGDQIPETEKRWVLMRYRGLRPQETRGRVTVALPWPMEMLMAEPLQASAFAVWYGRSGPGRWVPIHRTLTGWASGKETFDHSHEYDEDLSSRALLGVFLAKQRLQQWRVYLGLEGQPGLELPTTSRGAAEVFRLRDIPEGKDRRLALRHWVAEHWRAVASKPEEEVHVREHLRGVQNFVWNGLRCRITPSRTDQKRADLAKQQADEARRQRTNRRRR